MVQLDISKFLGHDIVVILHNGISHVGTLDLGLVNEDWEEDGEKETLGLLIDEKIEGIHLDEIKYIAKVIDGQYAEKAG